MSSRRSASRNTGRWTREEHDNFLKGIRQLGKNWDAIHELFVPTRSETQIRTHAQKYFQKVDRGLSFPQEPYGSTNSREFADASAQDGGNDEGENTYYSDDAPAPTMSDDNNHFLVPPSTPVGAGAAAAGGAGNNASYANRGVPAAAYAFAASSFHATSPLLSGPDQMVPASPDFGPNPLLGSGLPDWHLQMPSEGMGGGMVGGAAATGAGRGSAFGNRHATGPDGTEDALLAAVAGIDSFDSGTCFNHFDTHGGSPASWTGYNAGGTLYGPPPSEGGGPWIG